MTSENRFNESPLLPPDIVLRTKCHPEAMGRVAEDGERCWTFLFTLEDGRVLAVEGGQQAHDDFRAFLLQEEADDVAERLLGDLGA